MLGRDRGDVRVVVLHADGGHPALPRERRGEPRAVEVRVQVVRDRLRLDVEHGEQVRRRFVERPAVGALSRSPTCCDRNASSPRVTQTAFLRKAPMASTAGPAAGSLIATGV